MRTAAIISLAFALAASAAPTPAATGCVAKNNACRANDPVTGLSANQAVCAADNSVCQSDCYDAYNECRSGPDANMSTCASEYGSCLGQNPFGADGSLVIKPTVKARTEESNCVAKDNACRANDPVTGLSANQAVCAADNSVCQSDCYDAYNECRSGPDANMSTCASQYGSCLGQDPFGPDGSLVIKPTVKARSEEDCVAKDNACRASDPVTGLSANQAQCSADNAACKGACDESYNACRTARPNGLSANMAQCASDYVVCLGEDVFSN